MFSTEYARKMFTKLVKLINFCFTIVIGKVNIRKKKIPQNPHKVLIYIPHK